MSAKQTSQNCNRKPDSANNRKLCILCFEWFQKCQEQNQASQENQNLTNYQELLSIYNNLANGVPVDTNIVMRALLESMMNQNVQVVKCRQVCININCVPLYFCALIFFLVHTFSSYQLQIFYSGLISSVAIVLCT